MNPFFRGKHASLDAPEFRAFVVSLGCLILDTECEGPVAAHHEPPVGQGGSDVTVLPLCALHHRRRHMTGVDIFGACYGLNLDDVRRRIWDAYLIHTQRGAAPLPASQPKRRSRGANLRPLTKRVG